MHALVEQCAAAGARGIDIPALLEFRIQTVEMAMADPRLSDTAEDALAGILVAEAIARSAAAAGARKTVEVS